MSTFPTAMPQSRVPDPQSAPGLRWGILAPGGIARNFVYAAHTHTAQRVVAVGSRDLGRAETFAKAYGVEAAYGSYQQLVEDPAVDIVYISSPHSEHHQQALLAIAAGKPVLVEKSFTQTATQAEEVLAAGQAAGVAVVEAMWSRFLPHYDVVRQLVNDGALGDLVTLDADHGQYFPFQPEHRMYNPALAGGALLDLGIYPISFAAFVAGAPTAIQTVGQLTQTGVDGQVSAVLSNDTGFQARVHTTLFARTPTTASVSGSDARIEIPGMFYVPQSVHLISREREGTSLVWNDNPIPGHEGFAYQIAEMARIVSSGRREAAVITHAETVSILRTIDEIRRQVGAALPGD